jgi:hypothetical protein
VNLKFGSVAIAALMMTPFVATGEEAATGAPAAAAANGQTGTVIFYREKSFKGAAVRFKVRENGVELCKLSSGTYCLVQVPAGQHKYEVHSEAKDALTLEVDSGETYYVKSGISMGFMAGHPNLSPSTKEEFEGMKAKLKDNTGKDLDPPEKK